METKYGKLISRDKFGNLVEVYPEVLCDTQVDWENRQSKQPVSNYAIADAIEASANTLKEYVKTAFSSPEHGLSWDEETSKGVVEFTSATEEQAAAIVGELLAENGSVILNQETGKLDVDFTKIPQECILSHFVDNGGIIVDAQSEKLDVDFTKIPTECILAHCSSTGGVVASTEEGANKGKLSIDFSRMPTSQITDIVNSMVDPDGALVADETSGKLTVDFTKLTSEQIMALCLDGGGIVADEETGKLKIDFSNMPTDKFEEMLSAMKMQVPLENDLDLYVDMNNAAASDEIVVNRGTAILPFASIKACIDYATQKYALGRYDIRVHIKQGIYYTPTEIVLPSFTRTTGSFVLISEDGYGKAIVRNSSPQNTLFYSSGGSWYFRGMALELTTTTLNDGYPHHPACIIALYGPDIFIESCQFTAIYTGENTPNSISIRGVAIDLNSNLYIVPNNMGPTTFHVERGQASYSEGTYAIYVAQNSHVYFNSTSTVEQNNAYSVLFSGLMQYVFLVGAASAACTWGGSLYSTKVAQNPNKTLTAQTYHINASSYMAFGDYMLLPKTGFIDESTFCWYR